MSAVHFLSHSPQPRQDSPGTSASIAIELGSVARDFKSRMGFFDVVERLYEGRRALTLFTLVLNLCFGMAFSITTFNVVGRCVTEPCVAETAGLLRINSGTSFGLLLTGFLFILQPVYGLWFFRVKCSDVVGGAFVGATVMLSLTAMMCSSQWSYIASGVATMDPIVASSGVVVKGNETFFSAFEAIAALAGLMCALLAINATQLSFCLECGAPASLFLRPRHFFTPFLLGTFATTTPPSSGPSASPREYAGATSTRASTSPRMPPSTTTISTMTYKRPLPTAPPLASAASRDAPAAPPPPPRASSYRGPGGFVHTPATFISSTPADAWDFRGEL